MNKKFNRRDFLKTSGVAFAGAMVLPNIVTGLSFGKNKNPMKYTLNDYLEHFGVTKADILEVLAVGLSRGGDYCDLYFEHSISNSVALEDNSVNRASSNISFGVGIRVLNGEQTGYSYTEEITLSSMKSAARTAANIADGNATVKPSALNERATPNFYKINTPWEEVSINSKIPLLQTINDKAFALDPRIVKTNVFFSDSTSYILFANSEGVIAGDYQPMVTMGANCVAEQDGRIESNGYNISGRDDIRLMSAENLDKIARLSVEGTILLFDAVTPRAGQMPMVMAAGSSGILLHEAIGHGIEADFNRRGESIFSDKIGKKVAEDFVTIVDDATVPNMRGSINIDDEGNPTKKTVLVENGILTSYIHDRISAKHYGVEPTGSGRRESFRHIPLPRMRNTYMLDGPHRKQEIIESVEYGIYAETFSGGQVKIGPGDFTFFIKQGYLIENGKLTAPIKDVNIIGNGPKVLEDIVMVGNDMEMSEGGWTCGKAGQGVPASMGQPTVKVSSITVGGRNA
jgi:TldD protein